MSASGLTAEDLAQFERWRAEMDQQMGALQAVARKLNLATERYATGRRAARMYRAETGRRMPGSWRTRRLRKKRLKARPGAFELDHRRTLREVRDRVLGVATAGPAARRAGAEGWNLALYQELRKRAGEAREIEVAR